MTSNALRNQSPVKALSVQQEDQYRLNVSLASWAYRQGLAIDSCLAGMLGVGNYI